jgi:hypothetical protein
MLTLMGVKWVMNTKKQIFLIFLLFLGWSAKAQQIVYSESEREDNRRLKFEVIGKVNGQYLIYKNNHNKNWISILDEKMQSVGKTDLDFLPSDELIINIDFFAYPDRVLMVYQYEKRNVVYCMAAVLDPTGASLKLPIQLDSTHLSFTNTRQLYAAIASEDKKKIAVFKVNNKNKSLFWLSLQVYNDQLELLKKSSIPIAMEERRDELGDFVLNNEGDLFFPKMAKKYNESITEASILCKPFTADSLVQQLLNFEGVQLDEIKMKVDNANQRVLLASLYTQEKRGNIDGYYFSAWDNKASKLSLEKTIAFTNELRQDARNTNTARSAFNDFFIKNIITRKDGGFILVSESYYTTSRNSTWNRWDNGYISPYYSSGLYGYNSLYNNRLLMNSRTGPNQQPRYHADNILVQSFGPTGQSEWSNIIVKAQFDDESEDLISYFLMNTGGQLHFLYSQDERRDQLLVDFTIKPGGEINQSPLLKNLDKGYEFMPALSKQVSSRQLLMPCLYRNYICFAKFEFN